jgi:cation diffusion facilitator family transporter
MKSISAKRTVLTSFLVDILDIIINGAAAIITGSVVMLAETLQGVADLTAAGFLLIGLRRSGRPSDKKHPFGYGRELYVWALFSAVVMFTLVAGFSIYFGWERLTDTEPIDHIGVAYAILVISVISNSYAFSVSFRRLMGKNVKNIRRRFAQSPLIESKTTFILDLMGTMAALVGLIALILYGLTGSVLFDGLGAIMIGIIVAGFALVLMRSTKELLIGKSAPADMQTEIRRAAMEIPQVQEVLDLRTVNIGLNRLLVIIEVHLQEGLHTEQIEKVIDAIKDHVKQTVPVAYRVQVELETPEDEM